MNITLLPKNKMADLTRVKDFPRDHRGVTLTSVNVAT